MKIENMKRIMKTVLCLLAVFSFTAVPAPQTAYAADYGGFQYMVKDGEATITGYTGSLNSKATIPAQLDGCTVTSVAANAFYSCGILRSVEIPASVTSIGDKVFLNCIALREINYGGSASQWAALVENAADWNKGCPSDMVIHYSLWDLTITVRDQTYVYNGNIQGPGDTVYEDAAEIAEVISVEGLQGNDTITSVEIDGQASEIGEHKGVLKVTGFLINNDINAKERYNVILVPGNIIIKEEPVPPKPHVHDLTLMKAREATCTEAGSKAYYECGTCGRWFEDLTANIEITDKSSVIIKALGHDWDGGAVTKEPTYDEKGVRTYTCRRDSSHTKTEEIPEKQRISSGGSGRDEFIETHNYIFGYDPDHNYWYCRDKGTLLKDSWAYVPYNGRTYWYHFDGEGRMQTGWLTTDEGSYYLWPVSDGWKGRMVTGYQEIDGRLYYFETEEGKNQGRMYRNERTPDGNWARPDGSISEKQDEID